MGKLPRECFVMLSLTFPFVLELMKMQFLLLCHRTLSLASFRPWCRYGTTYIVTGSYEGEVSFLKKLERITAKKFTEKMEDSE